MKKSSMGLALIAAAVLSGCMNPPRGDDVIFSSMKQKDVVLLGEVHDNAEGHRQRAALIQRAVELDQRRPAIAMEQFDRERQGDLDRALKSCNDADCVILAAGGAKASWNWAFYKPVIDLALKYQLPLIAANVSRADGAKISKEGFAAAFDPATLASLGLDKPVPADIQSAQEKEIAAGHCGKLPATALPGMARAQVARDAYMAKVLRDHRQPHGVILLAGNGHVRRDLGAPRWLGTDVQALSVAFVEATPDAAAYDLFAVVPAATRPDPCAAFG
ncbi:hypothetical protein IGB42_00807 [Andreprevotia sp. IGB-42]|uniref:ChaN family lipoprotein n=1 Tax=Andreprevotia sp. IGB-42 TaxID=2497473 RepID=UPI00157EC579|nr:ChaN family lipoprotein [Andreprevotia sp. IGB-42]KAF0814752.1 hypothetical protein IGB42_00807 [Andreprevotia sp. IGB-42]